MASIPYTTYDVQAIMALVDDNKDTINDGEYIRMCNALKDLHNKCVDPPTIVLQPEYERYIRLRAVLENSLLTNRPRLRCCDKVMALYDILNELSIPQPPQHTRRRSSPQAYITAAKALLPPQYTPSDLQSRYYLERDRRHMLEQTRLRSQINNCDWIISRIQFNMAHP